jgi:protein-tyrosine phosphatase
MPIEKIECNSNDYTIIKYSYDMFAKANCFVKYYTNRDDMFEANEIIDGIYLGDINSVYDIKTLKKLGITHIVSVISGFDAPYPSDFNYLVINALDNSNTDLLEHFNKCNEFIDAALYDGGKVLIHCQYGRSRSATMTIAYIIKTFGMHTNNCLNLLKNKRNIIKPNDNFVNQLNKYYDLLYSAQVID